MELEQAQQSLTEQLSAKETPHSLLVAAVDEAEVLLRKVLQGLDNSGGSTCTPDHLLETTHTTLDIIDSTAGAFSLYSKDPTGMPSLTTSHDH